MTRVAITGIGLVTPVGAGKEECWAALLSGASGIRPVCSFDTSAFPVHLGAEVLGFDPGVHLQRLDPAATGRASQLAVAAARMALRDAGLDSSDLDTTRTGISMGTTSGEPRFVELYNDIRQTQGLEAVPGDLFPRYPCHVIPTHVAIEIGARGPCLTIPTACAAGNYAIGYGFDAIRAGRADVMLAGGADAFSRIPYMGFARLGAIAPDRCQPFDRDRKGMIPGEGAAVLVLERLPAARARGARIYAEVLGYGVSCDSHHMTAAHPEGDGAVRAMAAALQESGVSAYEVDYISAHGTGTPTNDRVESLAVRKLFGHQASNVPISSIKSMLGHTMGAASAIEAAVCAMALETGWVPPTMNYEHPDPECDLDFVPNRARKVDPRVVLNNAYAFGGNNASLCLAKVGEVGQAILSPAIEVGQAFWPVTHARKPVPRVVATAAGVFSPLGAGLEDFACALYGGRTAVAPSSRFPGLVAADLGEFDPKPWLGNKGVRVLDRSARLLAIAAHMALAGADSLQGDEEGDPHVGLVCGTAFSSVHSITAFDWSGLQDGPRYVSPLDFANTVINAAAGQAAIRYRLRGVNSTVCAGFASGLFAIHYAAEFLRFGRVRALLAGGVEELCEESALGFSKTGEASLLGCPRPFAPDRDGVAPGEGSALWMLECEETALARGRTPWFEILGFGSSQDATAIRGFNPRAKGAAEAMELALANSEIAAEDVACIIASSNGSPAGDGMEARALDRVFGSRLPGIPLCAPKAAFGETAGASGALSVVVGALALQQQAIPPTAGYNHPHNGLRLSSRAQPVSGEFALVNAFSCDGNNASLVIRLWKN